MCGTTERQIAWAKSMVSMRLRRADRAQIIKVSADHVRVSITHGISHEDAGGELLEYMRCAVSRNSHCSLFWRITATHAVISVSISDCEEDIVWTRAKLEEHMAGMQDGAGRAAVAAVGAARGEHAAQAVAGQGCDTRHRLRQAAGATAEAKEVMLAECKSVS